MPNIKSTKTEGCFDPTLQNTQKSVRQELRRPMAEQCTKTFEFSAIQTENNRLAMVDGGAIQKRLGGTVAYF